HIGVKAFDLAAPMPTTAECRRRTGLSLSSLDFYHSGVAYGNNIDCVALRGRYSARRSTASSLLMAIGFMATTRYDVLGIGNAIVDVIARTEDDFLVRQNMRKGGMQLIDEARAEAIYEAMGPAIEISG